MWILPAKWHGWLLLTFYGGAPFVMIGCSFDEMNRILSERMSMTIAIVWMAVLLLLNFTPSKGEKFSDQNWIV